MIDDLDRQTLYEQAQRILEYLLDSPDQTVIPDGRVRLLQETLADLRDSYPPLVFHPDNGEGT